MELVTDVKISIKLTEKEIHEYLALSEKLQEQRKKEVAKAVTEQLSNGEIKEGDSIDVYVSVNKIESSKGEEE